MAFVSSFLPPGLGRSKPCLSPAISPIHPSTTTMGVRDSLAKFAAVASVAALLVMPTSDALAARSGGRIGGSSFGSSRPSPSRSVPRSGGYSGYSGGYSRGMYSPIVPMPFFSPFYSPFSPAPVIVAGGGGGSIVSALVVAGAAAFLIRGVAFRAESDVENGVRDTCIVKLKVGLLANATRVRDTLDDLARGGDTSTARGLSRVLGDTVVSLLRATDFWVAGSTETQISRSGKAEQEFNRIAMGERAKLARESLSNVGGERRAVTVDVSGAAPEEYVIVTLLVATDSALARKLPRNIKSGNDVKSMLGALSAVQGDEMQALEVLWAPQQRGDSMTRAEMLLDHPELTLF